MIRSMEMVWTPRRQGNAGEFSAMEWLVHAGAIVAKPLFEHPDYDLIADFGDRIHRVQVKTSTHWAHNRFVVALCTRGGNQSWNGIVKRLDATRCDTVFIHVGDGRRWYIPATALGGGSLEDRGAVHRNTLQGRGMQTLTEINAPAGQCAGA